MQAVLKGPTELATWPVVDISSLTVIFTRPALPTSLGALPGCGKDCHPHVALEPFVREVWPIYPFQKGPFLGYTDTGKVKNRFSQKNQL